MQLRSLRWSELLCCLLRSFFSRQILIICRFFDTSQKNDFTLERSKSFNFVGQFRGESRYFGQNAPVLEAQILKERSKWKTLTFGNNGADRFQFENFRSI